MCATCGCEDGGGATVEHEHVLAQRPVGGVTLTLDVETRLLAKNDARAAGNRRWFAERDILALNLMSSPGAGKTSLLVRTIRELAADGDLAIAVIEGDQETANDAERIRAAGAPVVQVNTGTGCHLEADMVARGLASLAPRTGALVMIENVGNLVCPAMFDLGERAKVVILSVTEGDDKPLKYPHMFRAAELVILNKIDLLPHVDFSVARGDRQRAHGQPADRDVVRVGAHRRRHDRVVRMDPQPAGRRGRRHDRRARDAQRAIALTRRALTRPPALHHRERRVASAVQWSTACLPTCSTFSIS